MSQSAATLTPTPFSTATPIQPPFTQRKTAWMPVWLVITFNVYWIFWLYKTYHEIRQHSATATTITPGRAVGFFFIPVFNIYWLFRILYDFPRALARVGAQCSAEVIPSAHITGMMIAAFVLNSLGYLHPSLFVAGEILLATALVVCQRTMNGHTHAVHPAAPAPRHSFAELIGATEAKWNWRRPAAFAFATFASTILISLLNIYVRREMTLTWRSAGEIAALAIFGAIGAYIAFRYIRNEWLAALTGGAIFAVGQTAIVLLAIVGMPARFDRFQWESMAIPLVSEFMLFASLALFLRLIPSLWKGVLLGALCAEFADTAAGLLYVLRMSAYGATSVSWYGALATTLSRGFPERGSVNFVLLLYPLLDLVYALLFVACLWLAHKLWVRSEVAPGFAKAMSAAYAAGAQVPATVPAAKQKTAFNEADNLGTRHDRLQLATSYWVARMASEKKDPFTMYLFDRGEDARAALLELPCIRVAQDTGNLICTEVLIFGYYANEQGKYEALVCGDDLTCELWEQAKASFEKHGGQRKNDLAPERHAPQTSQAKAQPSRVVFVREERVQQYGATFVYRIHRAPDGASAKAFLEANPVTQQLVYVQVETPEGTYCRDIQGMYKQ